MAVRVRLRRAANAAAVVVVVGGVVARGSVVTVFSGLDVLAVAVGIVAVVMRRVVTRLSPTHIAQRTGDPTCWIGIHAFLGQSHTNTNNAFRLCNPVYDMDTYTIKVNVFAKQTK